MQGSGADGTWDSCGGWREGAAAGACAGACARAEVGSNVCPGLCHRMCLECGAWAENRLGQVALGAFPVVATKICPELPFAVA